MKSVLLSTTEMVFLLINQAYAIDQTFTSNTTISTAETIDAHDTWIIEDGVTLTLNAPVTNYGTIIIKGAMINNDMLNNFGMIINNDTLRNTYRITNNGIIINNGMLENEYILTNLNTINNTSIIHNTGFIYNFGNINNNTGIITDEDMLAIFPGVMSGQINNEGHIIEPNPTTFRLTSTSTTCSITLSDNAINSGDSITATVDTNGDSVTFEWIDPLNNTQRTTADNSSPFEDTFTPNTHGEWIVKATCDGDGDTATFNVSFNVLPESSIGIIALLTTSLAVFAVYTYRRIY